MNHDTQTNHRTIIRLRQRRKRNLGGDINLKTKDMNFKHNITKLVCISIFYLIISCTSNNDFLKGKEQLENQGYTDIVNTGYNAFCCDEKDNFSTGFKAKDKNGNEVKGCICSGILKGITIRFE